MCWCEYLVYKCIELKLASSAALVSTQNIKSVLSLTEKYAEREFLYCKDQHTNPDSKKLPA